MMDAGRGSSEHDLIDPDLINRVTSLNVSGLKTLNSKTELEVKQLTANVVVVIPLTDRMRSFFFAKKSANALASSASLLAFGYSNLQPRLKKTLRIVRIFLNES